MITKMKEKTPKFMALVLALSMVLGSMPVSLMNVFAATTNHPETVTITVVDDVTGDPIEDAKVTYVIYDNDLGEEVMGNDEVPTDENGEVVILDTEPGNVKLSSIIVTHDDYATYANTTYNQDITSVQDNFTIEMSCVKIKDVTVTPNDLTYSGEAQDAVTIEGLQPNDVVTYTINGEPSVDGKVTDADDYNVVVRVERERFNVLEIPVNVTVKKDTLDFDISAITGLKYNEQEQLLVTLSGTFAENDTVTWNLNGVDTGSQAIPTEDAIGTHTVKLTVVRDDNYETFEKEVTVDIDTGVLNIENLEIKANDRTYDESEQEALIVSNKGDYNLEYKLGEEGTWIENVIPTLTEAGTYKIYVRATKTGYHNAEYPTYPISVTIAQAKIEGVTATGYSARYNLHTSSPAITSIVGTIEGDNGDTITYSKTKNGDYSETNPIVTEVNDSGTYYVKVYRNDNYETLIIPVTVSITKSDQQISFSETPARIYNEANTFKYVATTNAEGAKGGITYSKENGGTANYIVEADGTVTYTSVGTIKVRATISACDNYESASKVYEITVSYPTTPAWTITDKVVAIDGCDWYNGDVVIKAAGWEIIEGSNALGQNNWKPEIKEATEKDYPNYKVAFRNASGDITDLVDISHFAIDKTAPTEKTAINVEFKDKYDDPISKVIHFLTFGLFCNEKVEVTVTCDDEALETGSPNSGIATIQLFKYDMNGTPEEVALDSGKNNVFTLPIGFEGTVKVKVTDKVGNTLGEQLITKDNSNMENVNGYIMVEEDAPVLSDITDQNINGDKAPNGKQYASDIRVTFDVQDADSGLYSVTATVNGVDYTDRITSASTPTTFTTQDRNKYVYSFTTEDIEPDENGKYVFVVKVVDNAGNISEKELMVEKDLTAPIITDFDFESVDGNIETAVSIEDYGYYFKEDVTVKVSAEDRKKDGAHELISGVKEIAVVLVDKDGKYYTVNKEGKIIAITSAHEAISREVTENAVTFMMIEDFKGQIYAFATDNVGNNPLTAINEFDLTPEDVVNDEHSDLLGYKRPHGSVLESSALHSTTSSIVIDVTEKTSTQNESYAFQYSGAAQKDKEMSYDDSQKVPLYKSNPTFTLKVTDSYSGIRSIKTTVIENGTETVDVIDISNTAETSGSAADKWTIKNEDDDSNLIYYAEREYVVDGNFNNMVILVELTDRAGNTSYDYYTFGIDKTAPVMIVKMNDNDDDKYAGFFKDNRTYEVIILERNFINDNVTFVVTVEDENGKESPVTIDANFKADMDGDKPQSTIDENGVEYYTYKWSSEFEVDGDYKFSISSVDLAENETLDESVSYVNSDDNSEDIRAISNVFTVDKTLPLISVRYDNNTFANDKYFAKARTAKVVIKEHNFDVERVDFSKMIGTLNGNRLEKQPEVQWTHEGNTHTAVIVFNVDGDYTFDVQATDMAANESETVDYGDSAAPNDFVVDQTIVKPIIGGITNGGAYKKDVVPTISFNDVNYKSYEVKLERTRYGEKNVNVTTDFIKGITEEAQGISGSFDTFEWDVKNDGIYKLSINVFDKAGNTESEEYTFSVNRFGSVYTYENELADLIKDGGQYVHSVDKDLVITEYNADKLLEGSLQILITRDGESIDVDYTSDPEDINAEVGIGGSGWYQYNYTIKASNFKEDGVYKISLASKYATSDSAENDSTSVPENSFDEQGNEILDTMNFTVDSVAPEIRNIVNLDKKVAEKDKIIDGKLKVEYTIVDVGGLKSIQVIVNGKTIQNLTAEDIADNAYNYTGSFELEEQKNDYKVQIIATDLADHKTDTNADEFLEEHSKKNAENTYVFFDEVTVSRNFFVRWYANTGLFWGSIAGVVALAGGIWFILAAKKKKEESK